MPAAVRIRRVAAEFAEALKRLARRRHRSSPGELRVVLDRAARKAATDREGRALRLITVRTGRSSSWNREEIHGPDGR